MEASRKNKCVFPIDSDPFELSKSMERLPSMCRWAYLLLRSANNDIGDDRIDQAIEKYIAILQMGRQQCQQPLIVGYMVGAAIETLAAEQLNKFIVRGKATDAHLNLIEEALVKNKRNGSSDWARSLEGEMLIGKNASCSFSFQVNTKGKVRLSLDPTAALRDAFPGEKPLPTYWQKRVTKIGVIFIWFVMPSTPEKLVGMIDKEYERLSVMADPEYDWQKEPKEFPMASLCSTSVTLNYNYMIRLMVDMLEGAYYRRHDLYVRTITEQKGSRIIIALRRYKNENGAWPENLEDMSLVPAEILVDPVNNGSFTYNLVDDGFELYSKGENGIDEGGKYETTFDPNTYEYTTSDDRLIWPSKRSRAAEEETEVE